ncbi:MAG: sulfatase-like hydrolase/transferase, partial [Alistipes sp.]|nr:sulfatase-like hydrolase/transferase [Alistipes sp.]
ITATDWIWSKQDSVKRWQRTEYFVDKTLEFMERNRDQAFFVNLWPDDMHTPYVPDAVVQEQDKTWSMPRNFKAVLKEYDAQIGRLLDGMRRLGVDKNTIIIFTSDNGPMPYYNQQRTNGLRSMKCSLYEGGIRMPFIISWPERIPAGKIDYKSVVCSVDIYPSLCALTGAKMPEGVDFSGEDMSQVFLGEAQQRTTDLMWEFGRNDFFYRHPIAENNSPHLAIRRGDMKLLINSTDDRVELYNLKKDPYERHNIAAKHPELVERLRARVTQWWDERMRINQTTK